MAPTTAPLIPYVAINKFLFFPLYPNLLATNLPLYEPAIAPTIPPFNSFIRKTDAEEGKCDRRRRRS